MKRNEHTSEFFKKFSLKENEIIRILIACNCIFILFFIGIKFNGYIESRELPTVVEDETYSESNNEEATDDNYTIAVDINTDNIFLLCQLPGIGEGKASAIIEYRKENGDFCHIEELLNVPGIGQSIYNEIKNLVYIEQQNTQADTEE